MEELRSELGESFERDMVSAEGLSCGSVHTLPARRTGESKEEGQ